MADEPVIGGVSVPVKADLTQYNAGLDAAKAKAVAFDQAATQAMGHTAQATEQAAAAVGKLSEAQIKLVRDTLGADAAIIASKGGARAAQQLYAEAVAAAGVAQGKSTAATLADTAATTANTASHVSSRAAYESLVLVHEALSGRFTRMTSSSLILGQAMLGSAGTAKLLAGAMSPVGLTIIGVTAAAIAGAAALLAYDKQQHDLLVSSVGLGASSGISTGQINQASTQGLLSFKTSINDNIRSMEAFSAAGVRDVATLRDLSSVTADYAVLTGEKSKEATKELAAAMKDPVKGAEDLNDKLSILDGTQLRNIRTLVDLGDKTEAQAILTDALKRRTEDAEKAAGPLESLLHKIATGASDAATGFGHLIDAELRWGAVGVKVIGGNPGAIPTELNRGRQEAERQAAIQREAQDKAFSAAGQGVVDQTPEARAETERNRLLGDRNKLQFAINADTERGQADAVKREREALAEVDRAINTYMSDVDKKIAIDKLDAQLTKAKTEGEKAAIAAQRQRIELSGKIMSQADVDRLAASAGQRAGARVRDTFTTKDATLDAQIKGELDLADAYGKSDAAAMRAEATLKAMTDAAGHHRTALQAAKIAQDELNLSAATAAANTAKEASTLEAETAARRKVDAQVEAGLVDQKQANELVRQAIALRPIEAALENASGDAKTKPSAILKRLTTDQAAYNVELARQAAIDATAKDQDATAVANLRASMVGQPKAKTDAAVARLQRQQQLGPAAIWTREGRESVQSAGDAAAARANAEGIQQFREMSLQIEKETQALQKQQATMGMTLEQADKYNTQQKLLLEAERDGIQVTDQVRAGIDKLASGYATASEQARKFAQQQKGAAEAAKTVTDQVEGGLEAVIFDGEKASVAARNIAKSLGKDALKATLSGEGPLAGFFGTDQSKTVGGPNGGVLSQIAGGLFGVGKGGAAKPTGAPGDPLYVTMAQGAGDAASNGLGMLKNLFGGGGGGGLGGGAGPVDELASFFHTGTSYVGTPSRQIRVASTLYATAPRLHSGLAPDEFPAILQRGERVVPRNGRSGGGGRNVTVNVVANDAASFGRSQRQIERALDRRAGQRG